MGSHRHCCTFYVLCSMLVIGTKIVDGNQPARIGVKTLPAGYFYALSGGSSLGYHRSTKNWTEYWWEGWQIKSAEYRDNFSTTFALRFGFIEGAFFITPRLGFGLKIFDISAEFLRDYWVFHIALAAPQLLYRFGPESRFFHIFRVEVMPWYSWTKVWSIASEYSFVPIPPYPAELFIRFGYAMSDIWGSRSGIAKGINFSLGAQIGLGLWFVHQVPKVLK